MERTRTWTIDEDGSFDVVEPTRIDVEWWLYLLVVAECLPGSWLVHPADFIRARANRQGDGIEHPRITHTHLSLFARRSEVSHVSLLTCRFLTLNDMF